LSGLSDHCEEERDDGRQRDHHIDGQPIEAPDLLGQSAALRANNSWDVSADLAMDDQIT
jgi:hypothetical protein